MVKSRRRGACERLLIPDRDIVIAAGRHGVGIFAQWRRFAYASVLALGLNSADLSGTTYAHG
jgi:hypothetical protein